MNDITKRDEVNLQRWANCETAHVDNDGDVWIEGPQSGHWMTEDEKARYLDWRKIEDTQ
jgi:hypothetical protein